MDETEKKMQFQASNRVFTKGSHSKERIANAKQRKDNGKTL